MKAAIWARVSTDDQDTSGISRADRALIALLLPATWWGRIRFACGVMFPWVLALPGLFGLGAAFLCIFGREI